MHIQMRVHCHHLLSGVGAVVGGQVEKAGGSEGRAGNQLGYWEQSECRHFPKS